MTPIGKPHATPHANGGSEFTQAMRYELLGEDERPLLSSYGISLTLGALWLSLVYFGPRTPNSGDAWKPIVEPPIGDFRVIEWPDPAPPITIHNVSPVGPRTGNSGTSRPTTRPGSAGDAIRNAFQNGGARAIAAAQQLGAALASASVAADNGVLRNVTGGDGGKVAISGGGVGTARGAGQSGAFTPSAGVAGGVGTVAGGRGSGVGHTATVVADPVVVTKPELPANARDVADVGQVVRGYSSQLQSCYEREGLKQNPSLAGTLTAAITITGAGRVSGVNVTRRTWSGPGADEAERCIVSTIRRWRFAPSSESEGTYSFPFSFTK